MADDSMDFWVYVKAVGILAAVLVAFFLALGFIMDFALGWTSWWTPLSTFLFLAILGTIIALFSEGVAWAFEKMLDGFAWIRHRRRGL